MGFNEEELASFLLAYRTNEEYRLFINNKYYNYLSLNDLQIYALEKIIKINPRQKITDNSEYTELTPILYGTDEEIEQTLTELFFGEILLKKLGKIAGAKEENIKNKYSNAEKKSYIAYAYEDFSTLRPLVKARFVEVKRNLSSGFGELAFNPYKRFNTNISYADIYGYMISVQQIDYKKERSKIIKKVRS